MQTSKSYVKDSGDLKRKTKRVQSIPGNGILVRADVVGLYPFIPHELALKAL